MTENKKNRRDKRCIACGGALHSLGTFHDMPASAQELPTEELLSEERGIDLPLCQCHSCGLVQFPVEPVSYYKDVIRAGGGTKTMIRLRHEEYLRLLTELEKQGLRHPRILEVGCGRGEFLEMWKSLWETDGIERGEAGTEHAEAEERNAVHIRRIRPVLFGIEHSVALAREAQAKGLQVFRDFAEGEKLLPEAPFDAFVQFNFLEHQPKPLDMLRTIRRNLRDGGLGLLTVPSFEYILQHDGYYELLRDHIANYTEETLQALLQEAGFELLSSRIVNRDTIEAIVRKAEPETLSKLCFSGALLDISPLLENYEMLRQDIRGYLDGLGREGKRLAIWGASHQGFTLAASTELGGRVSYIIDSARFKQGRFAPASHIPIVSPEHFFTEPVEEILIVAPGYTDEIADIIRARYGGQVGILALRGKRITRYGENHP